MKRILLLVTLLTCSPTLATERASEADMFGGTSTTSTAQSDKAAPSADDRGMEPSSSDAKSKEAKTEDHLQIGGSLSIEADYYLTDGLPLQDNAVANPDILFLYADSKLDNDARVFAKVRLFYDPTGISGGAGADLSNPYGFGTGTSDNLKISLQELRLSANIDRRVFFTFGRQKAKYGAAKFFNPTDFLNSQPLNFFLPSDERPGVDMVKAHVPAGISNFYAMGLIGTAGTTNPSGGYFRAELGYDGIKDLLGAGEISFSCLVPRDQNPRAGMDISQAVGDLDFYFEGAAGQLSNGDWKMAGSLGGTWQIRYADRGSNTISLLAEYFNAGQTAEYGIFSLYLPEPGNLHDITFSETNLFSFQDESGLSRLDISYNFTSQITGRIYGAGHWGKLGGVFHMPGQVAEIGTRLDVNF